MLRSFFIKYFLCVFVISIAFSYYGCERFSKQGDIVFLTDNKFEVRQEAQEIVVKLKSSDWTIKRVFIESDFEKDIYPTYSYNENDKYKLEVKYDDKQTSMSFPNVLHVRGPFFTIERKTAWELVVKIDENKEGTSRNLQIGLQDKDDYKQITIKQQAK